MILYDSVVYDIVNLVRTSFWVSMLLGINAEKSSCK